MQVELNPQQLELMLDATTKMANDETVSNTYRAIAEKLHLKLQLIQNEEDLHPQE